MQKYRRRSVVINAAQWLGPQTKIDGVVIHSREFGDDQTVSGFYIAHWITGPDGQRRYLKPGDWITVDEQHIELGKCADGSFRANFEPEPEMKKKQRSGLRWAINYWGLIAMCMLGGAVLGHILNRLRIGW